MQRIFPRYLVSILLPYLGFALAIFSAVLFMNQFSRIFNTAVMIGASFGWILYGMGYLMPMVLSLSVPMAFQLALLLTLTGLNEQGELLALRAAGFSVRQIVWPLFVVAVIISGVLIWVNNWFSPYGFAQFQNSQHMMAESITRLRLEPKTFVNIGDWRLYSEAVDNHSGRMEDVHLFRNPAGGAMKDSIRVSAPEGRYYVSPGKGFELLLKKGEFQRVDPKDPRRVVLAKFDSYRVFIPFGAPFKKRTDISLTEMSTPNIVGDILHNSKLVPIRRAEYKIEVSTRFAVALAPIIFFYLSCPFGVALSRTGRAMGMVLSIVILFAFYGLMAVGISVGKKLLWFAWYGPWLPNVVGAAASVWLWRRRLK